MPHPDHPSTPEDGFSLVELMVVLLIMGVLVAITIPIFLGFRANAADGSLKQELTTAGKVESGLALENGGYVDATAVGLAEPALDTSGGTTGLNIVLGDAVDGGGAVLVADGQVLLYARSDSGTWYGLRLVQAGVGAGRHTCEGDTADAVGATDMTLCSGVSW